MNKAILNIIRFTNEDVISTSSKIVVKGNYEACFYFTVDQGLSFVGETSTNGSDTSHSDRFMKRAFSTAIKNAYGEGSQVELNKWYALYKDGSDGYLYKHSDTDLSNHTHRVTD